MAQTHEGAVKAQAKKLGIAAAAYEARLRAGLKNCWRCRRWLALRYFARDRTRGDGRNPSTKSCRNAYVSGRRFCKKRVSKLGARFSRARDGDKAQARKRVNMLAERGLRPHPSSLPCSSCGTGPEDSGRRHEFHHHNGYGVEHHEDVVVLCSKCHASEHPQRRTRGLNGRFA